MVNQVALKGIVLSAAPHGEYDKRLVVLTGQRGKITVFVKGAKRPSNRFAAMCQPFAFGDFVLYQGKEAYNLVDVSISNYFDSIAKDMDAVYYGFYFLELADYYSKDDVIDPHRHRIPLLRRLVYRIEHAFKHGKKKNKQKKENAYERFEHEENTEAKSSGVTVEVNNSTEATENGEENNGQ